MHGKTIRPALRTVLAGAAVLGLLLLPVLPADAATPHVDVRTTLDVEHRVAPGGTFYADARASAPHTRGTLRHFDVVLHLPAGMTFTRGRVPAWTHCSVSYDRRTISCPSQHWGHSPTDDAGAQLWVSVSRKFRDGTRPTLTATTVLHHAVDPHRANNTARAKVLVKAGQDVGLRWVAPKGPVHPSSTPVVTQLVVTNYGKRETTVSVDLFFSKTPAGFTEVGSDPFDGCDWDPGEGHCRPAAPVQPGQSIVYTVRWLIGPAAVGRELGWSAYGNGPYDPNPGNNGAVLVLKVS